MIKQKRLVYKRDRNYDSKRFNLAGSKLIKASIVIMLLFSHIYSIDAEAQPARSEKPYHFDEKGISKAVLENYLERSITMAPFLIPDDHNDMRGYPYQDDNDDDIRMIENIGAKFIGRAIFRWGRESLLNVPAFWDNAKKRIDICHRIDPEIIFQAAIFEIVTEEVNQIRIPSRVFRDFGLPAEDRSFNYQSMLNDDGTYINHWGMGSSVPDILKPETILWFYFLATSYINIGCEALHFGQVERIAMKTQSNEPPYYPPYTRMQLEAYSKLFSKIRAYAVKNSRRHWVLLDAHVPTGGMLKEGVSLLDFNSLPIRPVELPGNSFEAVLKENHLDAIYNKSMACVSPSGWSCSSLPYLVELDNFGTSTFPNVANTESGFVWGWDEISWFALQPEDYRNYWLKYAYDWIKETDPNGHLQMPGCREIRRPNDIISSYRANTRSPSCPAGYSQEETIKTIWSQK
ncbi:MAG: hypothetical protein MI975_14695 [Cytophagales bacterium]|nr:hypothetical protein [Cytophagales bacterium]